MLDIFPLEILELIIDNVSPKAKATEILDSLELAL